MDKIQEEPNNNLKGLWKKIPEGENNNLKGLWKKCLREQITIKRDCGQNTKGSK